MPRTIIGPEGGLWPSNTVKEIFVMNKFLKKLSKNFVEACEAYYYVYGQH